MEKILILTGMAGFIGLNVLREMSSRGALNNIYKKIISIDKLGYATKYNLLEYKRLCDLHNITRLDIDINDLPNSKYAYEYQNWTCDILDVASESHVDNSLSDPFSIYNKNSSIPAKLLEWIGKENWKNIGTYWHISTDEVLSEIPLDKIQCDSNWFKTTSPIKPNNPYSASKAAQDCFLMAMKHTFGLNVKFIRMANQCGPYQHVEKMLPASILRVINGEPIKVYGNGLNIRQWTPVNITSKIITDIMEGIINFDDILHIAYRYGVYNNNEISNMISDCMLDFGYNAKIEYITDRLGHDSAYALDTSPLIDEYFEEIISFKEYLRTIIEFYINNKDLYIGKSI
jgi:dTDP-glucose 4,6-dehydratase